MTRRYRATSFHCCCGRTLSVCSRSRTHTLQSLGAKIFNLRQYSLPFSKQPSLTNIDSEPERFPLKTFNLATLLVISILLPANLAAQMLPGRGSENRDQSLYAGRVVEHPENLSGLWETPVGTGAVGIHLILTTTILAEAKTLSGTEQRWSSLSVGVYERKGAFIEFGDENFFTDSSRDAPVEFEAGHLRLRFRSVDLDLVQQAGSSWVGRLHRGAFDSNVTLRRSNVSEQATASPYAGTWLEESSLGPRCLHVIATDKSDFMGWSDSLQILGSVHYANGLQPPETATEGYGNLVKVRVAKDGKATFALNANSPACCSHTFAGSVNEDGTMLIGNWVAGPNQAERKSSWKKISGDSCTTP